VMYLGRIVETAPADALFANPAHPYTMALLSAAPVPDPELRRTRRLPRGEPPSPVNPPSGCPFHPRCDYAEKRCAHEAQRLIETAPCHHVACAVRVGRREE